MNKRHLILSLISIPVFAFLGGMFSAQFFPGLAVLANDSGDVLRAKTIISEEFRLVDDIYKKEPIRRAVLKTFNNPGEMCIFEMYDWDGKRRILFIIDEEGNPTAHFWDKNADEKFNSTSYPSISFWENSGKLKKVIPTTKN